MIVTTANNIRVEAGYQGSYIFERSSETPGIVNVKVKRAGGEWQTIVLPGNAQEMAEFCAAYQRCVT